MKTQRNSLILRGDEPDGSLEYLIEAVIEVPDPVQRLGEPFLIAKYQGMFERRVKAGQCFHRPYLGCREYPCDFEWAAGAEPAPITEPFGMIFRDFDFSPVWKHWPAGAVRPQTWRRGNQTIAPVPQRGFVRGRLSTAGSPFRRNSTPTPERVRPVIDELLKIAELQGITGCELERSRAIHWLIDLNLEGRPLQLSPTTAFSKVSRSGMGESRGKQFPTPRLYHMQILGGEIKSVCTNQHNWLPDFLVGPAAEIFPDGIDGNRSDRDWKEARDLAACLQGTGKSDATTES